MCRLIISVIVIVLGSVLTKAEQTISKTTTCVSLEVSDDTISQYINTIHNHSDQRLWVFFEEDTTVSNSQLIYNRLKHRPAYGMSMFEWITDGNVNWHDFVLDMWSTFIKIIPPDETFSIITLDEQVNEKILTTIRVIPEQEMIEQFRPIAIIQSTDTPLYQPNVIVVPVSHIK